MSSTQDRENHVERTNGMHSRITTLLAYLIIAVTPMLAQNLGAIAGIVRDPSGSVIPGVTVEASSPALIEGKRVTTTGGNGEYRIVDLRPGVYTVTFTHEGFRSVRQEGISLDASFTVTVNGDMTIGQTAQEMTVTAEAPLIDVQNSLSQKAMDRATLDLIPSGRDPFAVGQLVPGVTTQTPDVGGTTGMQQATLQVHGSNGNDNVFVVDGMQIQHTGFSGNQTGFYYNDSTMQSITYLTSSLPAEAPVGGIQISMIPQDGGNQFHGSVFGTGATQAMQSDNSNASLVDLGLKARNKIDTVYDLNATLGGPILKDRIWFFSSFRRWGANNFLANTFTPTGAQAIDDNRLTDISLRLTFQVNQKNKVSVSYDRGFKFRGHRFNNLINASFSDPLADVLQKSWMNYMGQAKWFSTITNRLLFDFGVTYMPVYYNLNFEPGVAAGTISKYDIVTSTIFNVSPRQDFDRGAYTTYVGNLAYVTGSHNLKTGIQFRKGYFQESFQMNGDMVQILSTGAPTSVRLYNTPLTHREDMNPDLGWFLQDSWRLNHRLSLNLGIRFDHMVMSIPAQGAPGGTWVPARSYPAQDGIVSWNTWSPRIGFAWDVFGDSKTAVKGGISKYDRLEGTTLAQNVNPNFIAFETCPWTNLSPPAPGAQLTGCTGFSGNNNHIDPNMKRPYQWEYTVMIQRQIARNTSVSVGYYGRHFYDLYGVVNLAVTPADYTPVTINNPLGGASLTVYNQNPSTLGRINLLQKTLPNLFQRYNGVEFTVNSRISKATVYAGFTIGKNFGTPDGSTTSNDFNNPNYLINYAGNAGYDSTYQLHAGFSYQMPGRIEVAGSLRENSGLPQSRTYNVTQAIVPGLTQVTQAVLVAPLGAFRYPWQNLLDLRVSRVFGFRERVRLEPIVDLFNVFNSSAVTSAVTTIGPSLLRPSQIDMGRLLRLGGRITF
jgi:carboxypeptidase family protein/TonB-dependent receptor-like protein